MFKVCVFEKELLIVPIHWVNMDHWLLAAVFLRTHQIQVYDSIHANGKRRHRAVFDRVWQMLQFEHGYHYQTPLPNSWGVWSQSPDVSRILARLFNTTNA